MDILSFARPPVSRRDSLAANLRTFFHEDEDGNMLLRPLSEEQQAAQDERMKVMQESEGYELRSPHYQNQLEKTLWEYRCATMVFLDSIGQSQILESRDAASSANDYIFFPEDRRTLYGYIRNYIVWAVQHCRPRSNKHTRPRLKTIHNRRMMIMHHIFNLLDDKAPTYEEFFRKTQKAMLQAAKTYGVNEQSTRQKSYFGRDELRLLIDYDIGCTKSIEVAETHHLAWAMAMVCGVRAGSMGFTKGRPNNYLRWRDIKIVRTPEHSDRFMVTIHFPYVKGEEDSFGLKKLHKFELTVMLPQNADNISIAISYRLLIILLRRKFLQQYTNAQQLLAGREFEIKIRDEHLHKPVFLASAPGGRALVPDKALAAQNMYTYLHKRANECGFPGDAGMHSWRYKQASEVARVKGPDVARGLLRHRPQTHTLEKHYLDLFKDLDIARIAYGEDVSAGEKEMRGVAPEVLYRAELLMTRQQHADFIETYTERYRDPKSTNVLQELRRLRRQAQRELHRYAIAMFKESSTMDQLKERMEALKNRSRLAQIFHDRIEERRFYQRQLQTQHSSSILINIMDVEEEADAEDDAGEDERFDAGDGLGVSLGDEQERYDKSQDVEEDEQVEPDDVRGTTAEGTWDSATSEPDLTGDHPTLTVSTDTQADVDTPEMPFGLLVREMFDYMLERKVPAGEPRQCKKCLEDETISQKDKDKLHPSFSALEKHLNSKVHTRYQRWVRHIRLQQVDDSEGLWRCEAEDCTKTYLRQNELADHINNEMKKQDPDDGHRHYGRSIGWHDPDFKELKRNELARARARRSHRKYQELWLGKREQIKPLEAQRPTLPLANTGLPSPQVPTVVGPPLGGWLARNRKLYIAAGVSAGDQPAFHEVLRNWPVDTSRSVRFGIEANAGSGAHDAQQAFLQSGKGMTNVGSGSSGDSKLAKY